MARTIAVSNDVYEFLKWCKLPNESFSSVIQRSQKKGKLAEIAGSRTTSKADWQIAKKHLLESETRTVRKMVARI